MTTTSQNEPSLGRPPLRGATASWVPLAVARARFGARRFEEG
ncbi:MAG TPA: hypothetical protein VMU95_34100 [Trebonia sp.]|nr:hypothetical protein [Trebonia sp.]